MAAKFQLGTSDDNVLNGVPGDDIILGEDGNDVLSGGRGEFDNIGGGYGDDVIYGNTAESRDVPTSRDGDNGLRGDSGNDRIYGGSAEDNISGGYGNDLLEGGAGNDFLNGDDGFDRISYFLRHATAGVTIDYRPVAADGPDRPHYVNDGLGGRDLVVAVEAVSFDGSAFRDNVTGTKNADFLYGGGGNDVLLGDRGNDIIGGGVGRDSIDGGHGSDTADYTGTIGDIVASLLGDEVSTVTIGGRADDTIINIENLTGGSGRDTLFGDVNANALDGGKGVDLLAGGRGNDTYVVDDVADTVTEASGAGTDLVESSVSFTLAGQYIENLTLTGASSINATGNTFANVLTGNAGVNTLTGGTGNDTYVVQNVSDRVVERNGEGTDEVRSAVSFDLTGQFIEKLTLTGTTNVNATGNSLDNALTGNTRSNILTGAGGRDTITPGSDALGDRIVISEVAHSTGLTRDELIGMDFNGEDRIDLAVLPFNIAPSATGVLNAATFDADLAAAVNGALVPGGRIQAIMFDPISGDLNQAGHLYLIVDADNDGSYAAGKDYVIEFTNMTGTLDLSDFI